MNPFGNFRISHRFKLLNGEHELDYKVPRYDLKWCCDSENCQGRCNELGLLFSLCLVLDRQFPEIAKSPHERLKLLQGIVVVFLDVHLLEFVHDLAGVLLGQQQIPLSSRLRSLLRFGLQVVDVSRLCILMRLSFLHEFIVRFVIVNRIFGTGHGFFIKILEPLSFRGWRILKVDRLQPLRLIERCSMEEIFLAQIKISNHLILPFQMIRLGLVKFFEAPGLLVRLAPHLGI